MTTTLLHPFERANLGKAPFRVVGFEEKTYQACPGAPVQPGSTCDYCGTAIRQVFHIASADGKQFKVGCDCVLKTERPGTPLHAAAKEVMLKIARDKRRVKAELDRAFISAWVNAHETELKSQPSVHDWARAKGNTRFDDMVFQFRACGAAGLARLARSLRT